MAVTTEGQGPMPNEQHDDSEFQEAMSLMLALILAEVAPDVLADAILVAALETAQKARWN